ncbi:hypothetical protein SteCoe_21256 [Stentor coeruleus]|uniref:SET domain-containing protein n=1 Tax=Stentor coeruleus TaxID=5963 RepID=A0A1R2BQI7_9CILI|nr:hypothetical protein SteCoe_21256 [Stentor coeruleus]
MELSEKAQKSESASLLKSWLQTLGCVINPKIDYPAIFDGQLYGMIARHKLNPGETVVLIKHEAIISTELLQDTEIKVIFEEFPEIFNKENPEGLDNQFLTLIIYEKSKGPSSKWGLYFNTMPTKVENLSDWEANDLLELQDHDIITDSFIRKDKNLSTYHDLRRILNKYPMFFPQEVTIELIEWCWKIIWTRSFMRSPENSALIPYADFINHGTSSTSFYFVDQKEEDVDDEMTFADYDEMFTKDNVQNINCKDLYEISFSALEELDNEKFELARRVLAEADAIDKMDKDRKKKVIQSVDDVKDSDFLVVTGDNESYVEGSQIVFEYGKYSNTSLLIHYGFAIPENRFEYYRLKIELGKLLQPLQLKHLPFKYEKNNFLLFYLGPNELCRELLRVIRALLWTPQYSSKAFFIQTDLSFEKQVLLKYAEILIGILRNYPSSIEDDLAISPNSARHYFAITYRVQKKTLIQKHIQLALSALKIVEKIEINCALEPEQVKLVDKKLKAYIGGLRHYSNTETGTGLNANNI